MRHLLAIAAAFAGGTASAGESAEGLLKKLGSPSYAEREAAGVELLKLGSAALPAVKAAAETNPDPEVRERAHALVEPLSLLNDSTKLLAIKPVTFEAKTLPLAAAVADFKQKTGIPVQLVPDRVGDLTRPVSLPAGDYPPWEALAVLLKAAGLREDHRTELPSPGKETQVISSYRRNYYDGNEQPPLFTAATAPILLIDGTPEGLPAARSGAVRVLALPSGFAANRVVLGAGRIVFNLDAAPVPSSGWTGASGVRITRAEDDDGRPIFADLKLIHEPVLNNNPYGGWGGRRVFFGGGGMNFIEEGGNSSSPNRNPRLVPVSLRTNDRAVKSLRRFEGVLLGEVHTANKPVITIDGLDRTQGVSHGGPQNSNVQISEYKKNDNGIITLRVRYESMTQWALQNMRGLGWAGNSTENSHEILNRIKFYNAQGKELAKPSQQNSSHNNDGWRQSLEVSLIFPKDVLPTRMVVTGTRISNVEVPFKLENVRVP